MADFPLDNVYSGYHLNYTTNFSIHTEDTAYFILIGLVDLVQFVVSILSILSCIILMTCIKGFRRLNTTSNRYIFHACSCYLAFFLTFILVFAMDNNLFPSFLYYHAFCAISSIQDMLLLLISIYYTLLVLDWYVSTYLPSVAFLFRSNELLIFLTAYSVGFAHLIFDTFVCSMLIYDGGIWLTCIHLFFCCTIIFVLCLDIIKSRSEATPRSKSPFEVMAASAFVLCWMPAFIAQLIYMAELHKVVHVKYFLYPFTVFIRAYPFLSLILFANNDRDYIMSLQKLYKVSLKSYRDIDNEEEIVVANGSVPNRVPEPSNTERV